MKGRFKRKKNGFFAFDMMDYNPGVGLCQFRLDFHILYVFPASSNAMILAIVLPFKCPDFLMIWCCNLHFSQSIDYPKNHKCGPRNLTRAFQLCSDPYESLPSNWNANAITPPGQSDISQVFEIDGILVLSETITALSGGDSKKKPSILPSVPISVFL